MMNAQKKLHESCNFIWINGKLIEEESAKIPILTHSLHYSGAVFEGERAYNGKVFKLREHILRLINSAKSLKLKVPYTIDEIMEAHEVLITKNNLKDAYIRPLIWCGHESLNLTNKILSTNLLIAAVSSAPRSSPSGLNIHIGRWRKAPPNSMPPQTKSSGHYNMNIVSKKEAISLGYDDALLLDYRGYVAECTTANIFFVKNNTLYTPIADTFLNGITRQTIIEIAKAINIKVEEKYIELRQIEEFDECFLTGTAIEIQKIQSIDLEDKKIIFKENKITYTLMHEYNKLVRN